MGLFNDDSGYSDDFFESFVKSAHRIQQSKYGKTRSKKSRKRIRDAQYKNKGEEKSNYRKPSRARRGVFIGLSAAFVCCLGLFLLGFTDNWFDRSQSSGPWEGKTEEQIRADLDAQVAEGEMNISIANTVKVPQDSDKAIAHIENIQANHVDQKVEISLADGDVIYSSGAIAPGHCINEISFNKQLSPGVYPAIATFTGYDPETHEQKGQIAAQINILVN